MYQKNLKAYKQNVLDAEMSVADPHRVIQLMMNGFLERLALAKGAIDRKDYEAKSVAVSKAHALLNGLQDSLDMSQGEISEQLYSLYDYMKRRLMEASVNLDKAALDEIANLMITIKTAWDKIPEEEKRKGYEMRQQQGPHT